MKETIIFIGGIFILIVLVFVCLFSVFGGVPEGVYWRQKKLEKNIIQVKKSLQEEIQQFQEIIDKLSQEQKQFREDFDNRPIHFRTKD